MHQARLKKNLLHARPDLIEEILFTVYVFEIYGGNVRTAQCFATWVRWERCYYNHNSGTRACLGRGFGSQG